MARDIRQFVVTWSVCAQNKSLPLSHLWSHLALDFVNGLPKLKGNTVILTVGDRFSNVIYFIPLLKLPSVKETTQVVVNYVAPVCLTVL